MAELATAARAAPALAVEGLSYAYAGAGERALEAVSLEVGAGEFVLLAGRSASGKSTLLRAACGLVPHFHGGEIEGRVAVAGLDAIATGPGELAAVVGYLAQDPETQVVSTTVAAEIELPLEMRGDPPSVARPRGRGGGAGPGDPAPARAHRRHALRAASCSGWRSPRRWSPGRGWSCSTSRPRSSTRSPGDELIWLLRRLNEEWGVAVLLAEHRLERCLAAADRVVAMEARAQSASTARPATSSPGRRRTTRLWRRRPRASSRWPGSSRYRSASARRGATLAGGVGTRRTSAVRDAAEGEATSSPRPDSPPEAARRSGGRRSRRSPRAVDVRDLWVELERDERSARRAPGRRSQGRAAASGSR